MKNDNLKKLLKIMEYFKHFPGGLNVTTDVNDRVLINMPYVNIKEDIFLKSLCGRGDDFYSAIDDFVENCTGKLLVYDGPDHRKELLIM